MISMKTLMINYGMVGVNQLHYNMNINCLIANASSANKLQNLDLISDLSRRGA